MPRDGHHDHLGYHNFTIRLATYGTLQGAEGSGRDAPTRRDDAAAFHRCAGPKHDFARAGGADLCGGGIDQGPLLRAISGSQYCSLIWTHTERKSRKGREEAKEHAKKPVFCLLRVFLRSFAVFAALLNCESRKRV